MHPLTPTILTADEKVKQACTERHMITIRGGKSILLGGQVHMFGITGVAICPLHA